MYNTNPYIRKYKRLQLLLLYLSEAGDQDWCLGHKSNSLTIEVSLSSMVETTLQLSHYTVLSKY
jgi:hypothetical protein